MKKVIILCSLILYVPLILLGCATTPQFTPLPLGVKVNPPTPDLPNNIAAFSGTWYGIWDVGPSTTLVVEKIKPPEASVIYSTGPFGKEWEGGFRHYKGRIEPGKLEVTNPERRITITYLLSDSGETLEGTLKTSTSIIYVTMRRQPPTTPSKPPSVTTHTPLPMNLRIIPPQPDLPRNIAAFSGTWYGIWDNGHSTTFMIEKIDPPEVVCIYSWGKTKNVEGGWVRQVGKIDPDKRKITIPGEDITKSYLLSDDGEKLEGEYRRASKSQINYVTMQRQPPTSLLTPSAITTPTPLPANIKIISPQPDLAKDITVFSGIWNGVWDNGRATTLVVERINPPEAIAIYSWGFWKKEEAGWRRHIGIIGHGRLELFNPETELTITYLLSKDGETLEGTWQKGGGKKLKATMRRQ